MPALRFSTLRLVGVGALLRGTFMSEGPESTARPYWLRFEQRPGYWVAYLSAPRDTEAASLAYWREIAAECRRRDCHRVLVIEDIPGSLSSVETYRTIQSLSQPEMKDFTVAFVDLRTEHTGENLFGELMAVNRGLRVRVFDSVVAAEQWLDSFR